MAKHSLCAVLDCGNLATRRGWCGKHYQRWMKHGDPSVRLKTGRAPVSLPPDSEKSCARCGLAKSLEGFSANKRGLGGKLSICKECISLSDRRRHEANKNSDDSEARKIAASEKRKAYYWKNKDALRLKNEKWRQGNLDHIRAYKRENMRKRRATPEGRLRSNISRLVSYHLTNGKGGGSTFLLLGYTLEQLKAHLERQFAKGMSWDNYGEWHVDHIRPLASFVYSTPHDPQFAEAWALTNLRPLWAKDNIRKGARRAFLI